MTFTEFTNRVLEEYGSINKYCDDNKTLLSDAGISRATFYHMFNRTIKNPTRENLIAFANVSGIQLEEVLNVFIVKHNNPESTN